VRPSWFRANLDASRDRQKDRGRNQLRLRQKGGKLLASFINTTSLQSESQQNSNCHTYIQITWLSIRPVFQSVSMSGSRSSRSTRPSRLRQTQLDFGHDASPEPRRSGRTSKAKEPVIDSEDEEPIRPTPRRNQRDKFADFAEAESSGDESFPTPVPVQRRQSIAARKTRKTRPKEEDDFVVDDDAPLEISSDDSSDSNQSGASEASEAGNSKLKKSVGQGQLWKRAPAVPDDDDDDESEDLSDLPAKASRARNGLPSHRKSKYLVSDDVELGENEGEKDSDEQTPPRISSVASSITPASRKRKRQVEEKNELAEELEYLRDDSPVAFSSPTALRSDKRKQALEMLKRSRAGASASKSRRPLVIVDSDDELDSANEASNSGMDEDTEDVPDPLIEEEDDNDFIDDDDATIGAPLEGMPLEFTSLARARSKDLFQWAVDWMVQNKINPGFSRDDEIYQLAFQKLNDQVKVLVSSHTSDSWRTPDFRISLKSRPNMVELQVGVEYASADCHACNRSNHPATWEVRFNGAPYEQDSLEDVEQASEDEDENITRNEQGEVVPPDDRVYYLGKFCMAKAQVAHTLQHWRYSLNQYILNYLRGCGELTPEKIVERDGMKRKALRDYAENLVRKMNNEGVTKDLYAKFSAEIEVAATAGVSSFFRRRLVASFCFFRTVVPCFKANSL
jgi:hypothetical protein